MSNIDWSNAPTWATKHGIVGTYREYPIWFNDAQYVYCDEQQEGRVFQFDGGCTYKPGEIYAVTERLAPQWSGTGLPPAGTVCEARIPHHTADGRQMIWCGVEVLAHAIIQGAEYSWVKETGADGGFYAPMMLSFRPIRTPSQIAADEREAAISAMCELTGEKITTRAAAMLYDAGYRKGDAK